VSAPAALRVRDVAKRYRRGGPAYGTLRDTIARLVLRRAPAGEEVRALDGVSLQVAAGETVSVIGRNGAGKSTLLKVVARVTPPDAGEIDVRGRLTALIELGAGFHPELTGRENVMLQAAILGFTRREARAALPEIARFADVDGELDTPVKYFSTGTYARLGFAVAVQADPAVLLVDEVLSVGDAPFRERCYDRIRALVERGAAVLFVSHDLAAVERVSDRALLLDRGKIVAEGAPLAVTSRYRDLCGGAG
jgi:ABC-type polysaccharide/polyol phosphate transport system ATPase subunit